MTGEVLRPVQGGPIRPSRFAERYHKLSIYNFDVHKNNGKIEAGSLFFNCARLAARRKNNELKARGFLARVLQHEYDHLQGVLIKDRTSEFQKLQT